MCISLYFYLRQHLTINTAARVATAFILTSPRKREDFSITASLLFPTSASTCGGPCAEADF